MLLLRREVTASTVLFKQLSVKILFLARGKNWKITLNTET